MKKIIYKVLTKKLLVSISIVLLTASCASMKPQEVPLSVIQEGFWDEYVVVAPKEFRLRDPNSPAKPGDCPNQKITKRIPGAMCVEARTKDPSRGCDVVTSTFGIGYCPKTYSNDEYGRKTAQLDSIVSAGTAAQNAILSAGQEMTLRMQEEGKKFLQTYEFSKEISSKSRKVKSEDSFVDTVTSDKEYFSAGDVLAYSRYGFYSECFTPRFDALYKVEMGSWFYRIVKDNPICRVPVDNKRYRADYINVKTSSSKASFNYPFTLKEDNGLFTLSLVDPIFGIKAFSRDGLTKKDITKHDGFIVEKKKSGKFLSITKVHPASVTLVLTRFDGNSSDTIEYSLNKNEGNINIDGLLVSLHDIDASKGAHIKIAETFQ